MRVMPGGGSAPTGNTYAITTVTMPQSNVSGYSAAEVEALLHSLDPSAVEQAGAAYTAASSTLRKAAGSLATHMTVLAESWQGQAAQTAAGHFKQLYETAVNLSQASQKTGSVLSWLGGTILPYYKNYKAPQEGVLGHIESFFGDNPQNNAAQQVMQRLNDRLVQANSGLPSQVTKDLPNTVGSSGSARTSMGGFGSASGGSAAGGAAGGGSGSGGVTGPVGGHVPIGTAAGNGSGGAPGLGAGTSGRSSAAYLANYSPSGGTAGYSPSGGTGGAAVGGGPGLSAGTGGGSYGPGGGPGLLPITGGVPGAGSSGGGLPGDSAMSSTGSGADVPGAGSLGGESFGPGTVLGRDGMISGVPGDSAAGGLDTAVPGAGNAAAGAGADMAAQADGLGMMPMMGGGAGQRERERYRQSWLPEDVGLWEPGTGTVPPVIGG